MILLIDNYDSFSYNLYQLVGSVAAGIESSADIHGGFAAKSVDLEGSFPDVAREIKVIRNDDRTVAEIAAMAPDALILSPGPGRPENAGICIEAIRYFAGKIPILGVCLGHQCICEAFGGRVSYAKRLMHGKKSRIFQTGESRLFHGMSETFDAARYHSLAAVRDALPPVLKVTAESDDGEVMAVEHTEAPVFGVQFHPESVLTPDGARMLENFLRLIAR